MGSHRRVVDERESGRQQRSQRSDRVPSVCQARDLASCPERTREPLELNRCVRRTDLLRKCAQGRVGERQQAFVREPANVIRACSSSRPGAQRSVHGSRTLQRASHVPVGARHARARCSCSSWSRHV